MAVTAAERGKQLSLQVVTAQSVAETQDSNTHWLEIAIIEWENYEGRKKLISRKRKMNDERLKNFNEYE